MPRTLTVPSRTVRFCEPCEHHKLIGMLHVRCGEGGYREYCCMHPEAYDDLEREPMKDPEREKVRQRLIGSLLKEGRYIGKTEDQPEWCPLKREASNDQNQKLKGT